MTDALTHFINPMNGMNKKLMLKDLKVGDFFIAFPDPDSDYRAYNVFEKINPDLFHNTRRCRDGVTNFLPPIMDVVKVIFKEP